jgi:hypothetical protein
MLNTRRGILGSILVAAFGLVAILTAWKTHQGAHALTGKTNTVNGIDISPHETLPAEAALSPRERDAYQRLTAAMMELRAHRSAGDSRKTLAELRRFLETLPKNVATALVTAFLKNGADAPTNIEFSLGPGGALTGAPSLRVFLLDYLASVDPTAAATFSATLLGSPTSPDEWALAMRNFARADATSGGTAFLRAKAEEMLQNAAWLQNPGTAFLEAFDVLVHTKDTAAVPLLGALVRNQNEQATAYAAYLTLDRLVIADPQDVLTQVERQPDLFKGRELMQSNFFARADVRDPGQRAVLEHYLLNDVRTPAELSAFAGVFPNCNYMVSNNLLTTSQTPNGAEILARDKAVLAVANEWLADPKFQKIWPQLTAMRHRLQASVSPAGGSR